MTGANPDIIERQAIKQDIDLPKKFNVVVLNDDFTPMNFVADLICRIFNKSVEDSLTLTMKIHRHGRAVCGTYTRDIAESKANQTIDFARQNGHPLQATSEPA